MLKEVALTPFFSSLMISNLVSIDTTFLLRLADDGALPEGVDIFFYQFVLSTSKEEIKLTKSD